MTAKELSGPQRRALLEIARNEKEGRVSVPDDLHLRVVTLVALERRAYVECQYGVTRPRTGIPQRVIESVTILPAGRVAAGLTGATA